RRGWKAMIRWFWLLLVGLLILAGLDPAFAQDTTTEPAAAAAAAATPTLNSGDAAWMLTSTALVLLMTVPGLALFYGGMVRKKNVLSVLMQVFATCCLVTIIWMVCGYTIAFTDGNAYMGDFSKAMLHKVTKDALSGTIPESVYMMFQMTFAIITPAL